MLICLLLAYNCASMNGLPSPYIILLLPPSLINFGLIFLGALYLTSVLFRFNNIDRNVFSPFTYVFFSLHCLILSQISTDREL